MGARIIGIADRFDRILHGEMRTMDVLYRISNLARYPIRYLAFASLEKAALEFFHSIVSETDFIEVELKTKDLAPGMVISGM